VSVSIIPLFAEQPSHPSVPLGRRRAGARREGQGRLQAGALRAPFTGASRLAGWRLIGGGVAAMFAVLMVLAPGAMSGTALAQDAPAERTATSHPYTVPVADASRRFGVPEAWIWAVMRVESNGNAHAVSPAGAMGLMQIMPTTWANLQARYRLGSDPFDVRDNILAGAAYLRAMFDRYGNATAMLAAYNAGPGRYDEYLSRGRPLPAETRGYIAKLAAITDSSDDVQLAAAPLPDRFAWRRAALFTVRSGAASTVQQEVEGDTAIPQSERPSIGLFVPISGRSAP
jgi:soluble lytic murein transglycosylase-like protein